MFHLYTPLVHHLGGLGLLLHVLVLVPHGQIPCYCASRRHHCHSAPATNDMDPSATTVHLLALSALIPSALPASLFPGCLLVPHGLAFCMAMVLCLNGGF